MDMDTPTATDPSLDTFTRLRPRLFGIAYRMLGIRADAEDIVQEAWLRWQNGGSRDARTPEAWLVTVVTRLSIDRLRGALTEREQYVGSWLPEPLVDSPETALEEVGDISTAFLLMLERLAPTDVKSAKADTALKVMSIANLGYQGITINTSNGDAAKQPMGQDKRVRQALSLAIDRKVLSQVVFEGLYEPMNQPFNPGNFYLSSNFRVPERDVAKAKALLKEAGQPKVTAELFVTNNPVDTQLGQVIQAMAQEAGIDVQLRATEFASQLRDQQQGKFQMSRIGWSGRIDPDGNIHPFVTTGGGQNDGKYSNPEVDRLLNEARTIYDPAERKKRYDAAQKILQDELPIVYLYNQTVFFALRKNIEGFVINPDGMIRLAGLKRS